MRSLWSMVLVMCLVLAGGVSCGASPHKVEEGDRLVIHQGIQSSALTRANLEVAVGLLTIDVPKIAEALVALRAATQPALDTELGLKQLQKNVGPPKDPKDYSPEASAAARSQSEKEHSNKGWAWLAGGVGLALAGLKIAARFVPTVAKFFAGPWGAVADTGVAFIDSLKRKGKVDAADLEYLKKLQEDARVQPFVKELAKKFEATVGAKAVPPA